MGVILSYLLDAARFSIQATGLRRARDLGSGTNEHLSRRIADERNAMTRTCPICGSEAEEIDQGTFDGTAFRCKTHGEVEVTYDALFENRGASPEQWERAFQIAWTRAAAAGGRSRIFTYDFIKD
jgi:hypothetical protein